MHDLREKLIKFKPKKEVILQQIRHFDPRYTLMQTIQRFVNDIKSTPDIVFFLKKKV